MIQDQELQEKLRNGDRKVLEQLYVNWKADFIAFGLKYSHDQEDVLDIYQDAVIELSRRFEQGLKLEKGSVKTYLFGIGKFLLFKRVKKLSVYTSSDVSSQEEWVEVEEEISTIEQKKMEQGYQQLGEKCKEILRLYYYRNLTINEIVERGHYKDANTVKSQKSRCMKQLKELIRQID